MCSKQTTIVERAASPFNQPAAGYVERLVTDLSFVDRIVEEIGRGSESAIPILQAIQEYYRYLPEEALQRVCEITEITPAQIAGVSTFYSQFRHRPMGRHLISLCDGTACHVKGSVMIHEALRRHLKISDGDDTDTEGMFTIQKVACLGCCTLAPVIQIDGVTYGHLTFDIVPRVLRDFLNTRHESQVTNLVLGKSGLGLAPAVSPEVAARCAMLCNGL